MFPYYSVLLAVVGGVLIGWSVRLRVLAGRQTILNATTAPSTLGRRVATYILIAGAVAVCAAVPMFEVELGANLVEVLCQDLAWGALLLGLILAAIGIRYWRCGKRKLVALGLLCVPIAYTLKVTPRVMTNGWVGAAPTTILIWQIDSMNADSLIQDPERLVAGDPGRKTSDWTLIGRYRSGRMLKWQERWFFDKLTTQIVLPPTGEGLVKANRAVQAFPMNSAVGLLAAEATYRALIHGEPELRIQAAHVALDLFVGGKNQCQREGRQYILAHQSELASALVSLLNDESRIVARAAIESLEQCAEQGEIVPHLKEVLRKAPDDTRGKGARRVLESWGVDLAQVREEMLAATRDASASKRAVATEQLARVWRIEDPGISQRLSELASDKNDEVACAGARAMTHLSDTGGPFALVLDLLNSNRSERVCFFQALVLRWNEPHLVSMLGLLNDRDPRVRIATAEWLADQVQRYGTDQADWQGAVRALKTKLEDSDASVRSAAERAIAAIARARGDSM